MILHDTQHIVRSVQNSEPLPVFRTETQRRLLVELFLESGGERTLSDLARALDVDPTTVMREIDRLIGSGLITERRIGRARAVAIDESNPYAAPLRQLLNVSRRPMETSTAADRRLGHGARIESGRHDRRPLPSSRRRP